MFKAMFEEVTLPLMIIDGDGRILFSNKGAERLTQFTRGELVGTNLRDMCAPYERSRFIFSNLSQIKEATEVDIDFKKKGGRSFMANITFAPFRHQGLFYLLLSVRDVTSRRVQEGKIREEEERYRKLLAERDRLEAQLIRSSKLASMGELAAGIAHEINNPLGIILGFAQDILDEIPKDDPLYESLKIIEQETARCGEVVKNLLDFARLKPPQITEVDIVHLLKDSIVLLTPEIKKNKIQVKKVFAKGIPPLKVDPQLIRQAFLNVMINAIQAMPYGGKLAVHMNQGEDSNSGVKQPRLMVTIQDTGQGIPKDSLGRIFDPFFTTKGSKGTGLGLSVCQRIIEDHGGKIEITSEEKVGTTCCIYLPIQ